MKGARRWLIVATLYVNIPPIAVANLIPCSLRDVTGAQIADRSSEVPPFCFTPPSSDSHKPDVSLSACGSSSIPGQSA